MASSAVAALKKALLVAVCVMLLLHSSMGQPASTSSYTGQQPPPPPPPPPTPPPSPPPASPGCHGQQPPPSPTPVVPPAPTPTPVPAPMPMPTPTPAPAPSPTSCSFSDCASQCTPSCQAGYHPQNCTALLEGAFNGCYESMINHTCPGTSCDHSGCGFSTCSCNNSLAASACQFCIKNAVVTSPGSAYWMCQDYNERYMGNCMTTCLNGCSKNCPQQPPPPTPTPSPPPASSGQQPPPSPSPTPVVPPPAPTPMPTPMPASPAPAPAPSLPSCNFSDCASQCTPSCQAGYHPQNCTALLEGAFNGCYASMINHTCPGKSCDHSGCGFSSCSCNNPHAVSACQFCIKNAVVTSPGSAYWMCQNYNERYMGNCMTNCVNMCSKNCPQQGA